MFSKNSILSLILIVCQWKFVVNELLDPELAQADQQQLVQKHMKPRRKEGSVRLVGGLVEHEGNVEIFHNSKFGAVCDDEWDKSEATVVCRQLGFSGGKVTHNSMFGKTKRKFWMDSLFCTGNEKSLLKCQFGGFGKADCKSSESAGVICKPKLQESPEKLPYDNKIQKFSIHSNEEMEIRLFGGRSKMEGRLEVRFSKGNWGSVCSDGFSLLEANVACKQMNFGYAQVAFQTDSFEGSHPKILLSGTTCFGNESRLENCLHHALGTKTICHGPEDHVAAIMCSQRMADLVFDHHELEQTIHLEDRPLYFLTCAMDENCLSSQAYEIKKENPEWHLESRRLLKFTAKIMNIGTADFRSHIPKHLWEWHLCHMHYHSMEVFATFDVIDEHGEKVAQGHKASFCLEDNQCMEGIPQKYACANFGDQGISVNCSDIYKFNIDCQWIDITEIDFGQYTLKVSVNPEFKVPEMSFGNNAAVCSLLYTPSFARAYNCRMERP